MKHPESVFKEHEVLHELAHFLPAQAPLKDFIHHNTLHAFQNLKFFDALRNASEMFGYKISLSLEDYRNLYAQNKIRENVLDKVIENRFGKENILTWKTSALSKKYDTSNPPRIGKIRSNWDKIYDIDLDVTIQPELFKVTCCYLDQGISIWNFPIINGGFIDSIREMEKNAFTSFFKTKRAKRLLINEDYQIVDLLKIIVGDESLYKDYLFDQQFSHQGWSGMVTTLENHPEGLIDTRKISLRDFIIFELLLEIDALDNKFGEIWAPLSCKMDLIPISLFSEVIQTELSTVLAILQEAFEWSYYDEVLGALCQTKTTSKKKSDKSFQALFCTDDRECSIRRYIENENHNCETFGTPGFFGVEFYFQPEFGKTYTKLCPAPVTPKYLIKEIDTKEKRKKEFHLGKRSHSLFQGFFISQTLGFWAIFRKLYDLAGFRTIDRYFIS